LESQSAGSDSYRGRGSMPLLASGMLTSSPQRCGYQMCENNVHCGRYTQRPRSVDRESQFGKPIQTARTRTPIMRQSVATNRVSHTASLTSQANSQAAAAKLLEKKKEFEFVSALEKASTLFLRQIEGIGEDCDIMADAGEGSFVLECHIQLSSLIFPSQCTVKLWRNGQTCSGY
jgi:hypothetical protein